MIELLFGREDLLRCRFAVSVMEEVAGQSAPCSILLATLTTCHGCARPPPELPTSTWAPLMAVLPRHGYTPDFLTPPPQTPLSDAAAELARIRATPVEQVARELTWALAARRRSFGRSPQRAHRPLRADPLGATLAAPSAFLSPPLGRPWPADECAAPPGRLSRPGPADGTGVPDRPGPVFNV